MKLCVATFCAIGGLLLSGLLAVLAEEARPSIKLLPVISRGILSILPFSPSLKSPVFLTHAGDLSGRLFVVEQPGTVRILEKGMLRKVPFLDIKDRVLFRGEQGLLGLAFHPGYRLNGRFFVNYTRKDDGATVIAEYHRSGQVDRAGREEQVLLLIPQPYPNHNGGMITFGPDGYLYIGMGDGGSSGDPQNRAQSKDELLGKLLRIDVNSRVPYGVPSDNHFVRGEERPEVFAKGLRNPWRFSFDRETGDLWLADVGQDRWEEINVVKKGGNYGWRVMEGFHCYDIHETCRKDRYILPLLEYDHQGGRCSITGGYVYRGRTIPELAGAYLYGDFCSGEIFAVHTAKGGRVVGEPWLLVRAKIHISSFGEDDMGEIYVLDHEGTVYLLAPGPK